ncbi:MAG: hypothetical protein NC043_07440 [Muribaculaceae bacterium]|nr:hypothetical protein [Muribaculaceae bacterium]
MKFTGKKGLWVLLAVAMAICAWMVYRLAFSHEGVIPDSELYPVRGLDISAHNGDIDFRAVRQAGYDFVFIKATEGSGFKDRRFYANISRARKAGLKVTAYHFFRFDATGYMQALNFIHSLRGQALDMPAVIDIEQWTNPSDRTTAQVVHTLWELIHRLEKSGIRIMLYTNKDGYDEFLKGRFDRYPIWLCSFSRIDPGVKWTFWQYTHRGTVPGVPGRTDLNVFRGSRSEWEQWLESGIMQ